MSAFAARLGEGRRSARGQKKTFATPLRMSARSRLEGAESPCRHGDLTICARDPKHDLHLSGTKVHYGTAGAAVHVVDVD